MIEMNLQRHAVTFIVLALFAMTMTPMVAQNLNTSNLTSSPYNRYGYGRLGSMGNTVTRSMGDVGIAIRSNQYTILANPASLTAIDTLTMIFSVGLDAQYGMFSENGANSSKWDAGFSYMSFQMPLWRNFAMSLSFTPYSMVGYYYGTSDSVAIHSATIRHDTLTYSSQHQGLGGVNNFMLGLGWRAFHNKHVDLNVGANAGWLFGTIEHDGSLSTSSQATSTHLSYEASVRGLLLQFGAHYTQRFLANHSITIGATFSPRLNLSVDTETLKYSADTISRNERYRSAVKLPMKWGVGVSYNIARKLTVTAEYEKTMWNDVAGLNPEFQAEEGVFNTTQRVAGGVEYQPKVLTNRYFKICRYRAGLSAKSNYLRVNGSSLREYTGSLGMSMPINRRSALDLGVGYSTVRPKNDNMVKENYITINVGLTFNEMMFFRGRLR
jgi:long-subunit fatty acid transport protein